MNTIFVDTNAWIALNSVHERSSFHTDGLYSVIVWKKIRWRVKRDRKDNENKSINNTPARLERV